MPSGMVPCSSVYESVHTEYGPAIRATRYVLIRGVVRKMCLPGMAATVCTVSALETTAHSTGAVTEMSKVAFRSGWSKHANMRLASAVSNCEYRYTESSVGSTNRCRPSPVFVYRQSASTTSSLRSARPDSARPVSSV